MKFKNGGVLRMVRTKVLDPTTIQLDMNNPRFSLFNFKNEKEVIDYLFKYEDIKPLALQMIKNGYITLGERVIVLETVENKKKKYIVLEGNRRIAALKIIFTESNRFSSSDRKKIKDLDIKDFFVDCDIVNDSEEDEARFKITAKHIDGIKDWNPTDKRVFYDNLFAQYRKKGEASDDAINAIEKVTPETKRKIKNALVNHRFLSSIYNEVKKTTPNLDSLSHLDTDVLISRVQKRIKDTLELTVTDDFYFKAKEGKDEEYKAILKALGEATWVGETLDTRSFSTQNMWDTILEEDKVVPGLGALIEAYSIEEQDETDKLEQKLNESDTSRKTGAPDAVEEDDSPKSGDDRRNNTQDNETAQKTGGKQKKYKLFLSSQEVEVQDVDYLLTSNVKILDENSNEISKNSSVFDNLSFSAESSNIAIKGNRILSVSENGKYTVRVKFYEIEKSFSVFLKIPRKKSNRRDSKELFSDKWFSDSVALLSSKDEYHNIISVLRCLDDNRDIYRNSDNFVMLSFLVRILVEYTSKAYWDKYREGQKEPSSLSNYINNISNDLYNKKTITKEQKKSFSNGSDLEQLNGQIHDYKSNISAIAIETIFKAYKNYLDKLFIELNK